MSGTKMEQRQVWTCGRSNEAALLAEIGGWATGCEQEKRYAVEFADLLLRGLVTTRTHVAPMGEWPAWALTEAGFARLAEIGLSGEHERAVRMAAWYAENARRIRAGETPLEPGTRWP